MSAIKKLNYEEALRFGKDDIAILDELVEKHMTLKIDFPYGGYDVTCGVKMSECNGAFAKLCNKVDDIL